MWWVDYGPYQWLNPALGKDAVETVEHLTYANMALCGLFYEAHNNISETEIIVVWCALQSQGAGQAAAITRRGPLDSAFLLFCFAHGFMLWLHLLF